MSRTLFENSKAALAFAAVTLVGAVAMVGTSDNSGILPAVVQKFDNMGASRAAGGQQGAGSEGSAPEAPATPKSVFGDYTGTPQTGPLPSAPGGGGNPMNAPMAPTAMVNNNPTAVTPEPGSDEPPPPLDQ